MSTSASEAPAAAVVASIKLTAAINQCVKCDTASEIALDNYRKVSKSEAVRLALTDRKALTAVLFASGDKDARRVSLMVAFVFPASADARKELDAAMEHNANVSDPKKRIPKDVISALASKKHNPDGKLTLVAALKAHNESKAALTRTPAGKTDQTASVTDKAKTKKKTANEIEEELKSMLQAACRFAVEQGYDLDDLTAILEEADVAPAIFKGDTEDTDADADADADEESE